MGRGVYLDLYIRKMGTFEGAAGPALRILQGPKVQGDSNLCTAHSGGYFGSGK